jgi:hypothetical protein
MVFNSAETIRLCGRLNRRFSEKRLKGIRTSPKRLNKFLNAGTNKRTLARIAYKSGTYPGSSPTDNVAKRWFFFLQNLPANVSLAIKKALEKGLTSQDDGGDYIYESFVFVAYEGPTTVFAAIDLPVVGADGNPTGTYSMLFSLQTAAAGNSMYTPPPDDDEDSSTEPDDGPPDIDSGSGSVKLKAVKKKTAKKKTAKKAAKKKKQ